MLTKARRGVELNYKKTDVWAIGSLAYLLVGCNHPLDGIGYPTGSNDDKIKKINEMMGRKVVTNEYEQLAKSLLIHSFDNRPSIDQIIDNIDQLLWSKLFDKDSKIIQQFLNHQLSSLLHSLFSLFFYLMN